MSAIIRPDSRGERGVFASERLSRGQLALSAPALVRPVLVASLWCHRCAFCLRRKSAPCAQIGADGAHLGAGKHAGGRCARCKLAWYCCREHQKKDFEENHAKECKLMQMVERCAGEWAADVMLLARIARKGEQALEMAESMALVESREREEHAVTGAMAELAVKAFRLELTVERARMVLRRFKNNNFGVVDDLYAVVAAGVFPKGAVLNHSCDANCVVFYEFEEASGSIWQNFRCVAEEVTPGTELCHSYCDSAWPLERRQDYLNRTYSFKCECKFCAGQDPGRNALEKSLASVIPVVSEDLALALFKSALATSTGVVDDVRLMSVIGAALTNCLENGDFEFAAKACESLVAIYSKVYSPWHPLVGLQLHTQGDLLESLQDPRATEILRRSLDVLCISYGDRTDMCRNLHARLDAK